MFSAMRMRRARALVLERDEEQVLRRLGELGLMQLTRSQAGPDSAPLEPRDGRAEEARCTALLAAVDELRRSLGVRSAQEEAGTTVASLDEADSRMNRMQERAAALQARQQSLSAQQAELEKWRERASRYDGLDSVLGDPSGFGFLHAAMGTLPIGELRRIEGIAGAHVVVLALTPRGGRQPLIVLGADRGWRDVEAALQRAGFMPEAATLTELAAHGDWQKQQRGGQTQLQRATRELTAEIGEATSEAAVGLSEVEHFAQVRCQLLEAQRHFRRTDTAVLLEGWIAAADAPAFERGVGGACGQRCIIDVADEGDIAEEQIPVLLPRERLLRPFAMLVTAYGLPRYREVVPTLFLALSYTLMFGMMFGDVGHGIVLALCGGAALRWGRGATAKDAGVLLSCGGMSSTCFGAVYGSWFGIESLRRYALWHDPLQGDPSRLMLVAIGIGVVVISLGLILNVANRLRRGDVWGAFTDKFGILGAVFYWGLLVLLTRSAALASAGLDRIGLIVVLVLPIGAWVLKEPVEAYRARAKDGTGHPAGLLAAGAESVIGAFEAVLAYLANTISFVRLAAYAMSHAALLLAMMTLAAKLESIPVVGPVLGIILAVLGNLVVIVLEGIIASVQGLRLEFYEFFGKFFTGGGQPFTPFRVTTNRR